MFGLRDLESPQSVIADARKRSEARQNFRLPSVLDMNLRYADPCPQLPKGGYMARINGVDLPVGDGGIKTACKLIKSKPDYFKQFADKTAFPQSLRNIIDNPGRRGPRGLIVRTGLAANGINEEIAAILPADYQIRDADEQLTDFVTMLEDLTGEPVKGIQAVKQGNGNHLSFRAVVGEDVMDKFITPAERQRMARQHKIVPEGFGQNMMFVLSMSETGLKADETTLGLYRLVCMNGAMAFEQRGLAAKWNHRGGDSLEKYRAGSADAIRQLGSFGQSWGQIFGELLSQPMPVPAKDLLHAMNKEGLITASHYDVADSQVSAVEIDTQYDFYNALTRSAQDLPSIKMREQAESRTLKLFTSPGGVVEALRKAVMGGKKAQNAAPADVADVADVADDGE